MTTTAITDLGQLEAAYQRTEQLMQQAAEAERAAFARWQDAYGAYEAASDQAATAKADWVQTLIH